MTLINVPQIELRDAAKALKVSETTMRRMIKKGTIRAVKVGGRYRFKEEWINESAIPQNGSSEKDLGEKKHGCGYDEAKRRIEELRRTSKVSRHSVRT